MSATILVVLALTVLLLPLPIDFAILPMVMKARSAPAGSILVVGNSVVDHVSRCDADQRPIPALLGDITRRPVIDLSVGGQSFPESLDLAAVAIRRSPVRSIVIMAGLSALDAQDSLPLQTQGFYRLAGGSLRVNDLAARIGRGAMLLAEPARAQQPFTYKGVAYPDYNGVKMRYMGIEKVRMGCPETLGFNRTYIEAAYWHSLALTRTNPDFLADLLALQRDAQIRGKRLTVILMPVDIEDAGALSPAVGSAVAGARDRALAELRGAGVRTLDASGLVPATGFSDRWCACGHMGEAGRRALVTWLAAREGADAV